MALRQAVLHIPGMLLAASPRRGLLQGQALSNDPASSGACKRKEAFDVEHGGAYLTVQQQWCLWPGMCCLARYMAAWPSHINCSRGGKACMLIKAYMLLWAMPSVVYHPLIQSAKVIFKPTAVKHAYC